MTSLPVVTWHDIWVTCPEIVMMVLAVSTMIIDLFIPAGRKRVIGVISVLGMLITLAIVAAIWKDGVRTTIFSGMIVIDPYAMAFKMVILITAIGTILISFRYLDTIATHIGEFYELVVYSTLGMMVLASSNDFVCLYAGLELMSLALYCLVAITRKEALATEAALKYFLLGIFSSAILLYGIALLYGAVQTTNLQAIARALPDHPVSENPLLLVSLVLITVGFGFKTAAVPFHMWAPDVYEGAPVSVAAFISVASKAATFAAMVRVFLMTLIAFQPYWDGILWVLAVVTMTAGNVLAMRQDNFKRMLAYSSIAQAGYLFIGLIAYRSPYGLTAILFYLFVYIFMNVGAFAMMIHITRNRRAGENVADFSGLAKTHPFSAILLVLFLLSLAGIPGTAGFIGKFMLFAAAIEAKYIGLAVIAVINIVISVYYYFRVVVAMYMGEPDGDAALLPSPALTGTLAFMGFATVAIGVYPEPFVAFAKASSFLLR